MGVDMIFNCQNESEIARIWNHPKVLGWITDDLCPKVAKPIITFPLLYLMNKEKTGVIMVVPVNGITCEVHTACLPELWGKSSEFIRGCIDWGMDNTRYQKIITYVPTFNRLAIRITKKAGFEQEGLIKESFLKNWKLYDQYLFGMTKIDYLKRKKSCQQ